MEDKEYFEDIYRYDNEDLKENLEYLEQKKGNIKAIMYSMRNQYKELGMLEAFYKMRYEEAKRYFLNASKTQEWFYKNYENAEYNIPSGEVTTYSYETLYYAILSGCKEQMIFMANYMGSFINEEEKESNLSNSLLGYSLKYVVLDDKDNAMKYITELENSKSVRGMKQYVEGHARAFKGLIQRNVVEFNKGLEFMLKHHVSRMKRDGRKIDQFFAYDSIALSMLAKERDIEITVKHELLLEDYFENL